jgi:hypothetical protein
MAIVETPAHRTARKPAARRPASKGKPKGEKTELQSKIVARIGASAC